MPDIRYAAPYIRNTIKGPRIQYTKIGVGTLMWTNKNWVWQNCIMVVWQNKWNKFVTKCYWIQHVYLCLWIVHVRQTVMTVQWKKINEQANKKLYWSESRSWQHIFSVWKLHNYFQTKILKYSWQFVPQFLTTEYWFTLPIMQKIVRVARTILANQYYWNIKFNFNIIIIWMVIIIMNIVM